MSVPPESIRALLAKIDSKDADIGKHVSAIQQYNEQYQKNTGDLFERIESLQEERRLLIAELGNIFSSD